MQRSRQRDTPARRSPQPQEPSRLFGGVYQMEVPRDEYDRIAAEIASEASPVGIDAKRTHVMILYKLTEIEKRLAKLEQST